VGKSSSEKSQSSSLGSTGFQAFLKGMKYMCVIKLERTAKGKINEYLSWRNALHDCMKAYPIVYDDLAAECKRTIGRQSLESSIY
jgi:hypothetical protein